MCHRLCKSNVGPLREHIGGVQSLQPSGNLHWLLDYVSRGFSMASLHALNSPNDMVESLTYMLRLI